MKKDYTPKYWNNKGKYQKTYEALYKAGVPDEGKAKTEWGEIVRVISRLYYDIYNNGAGNFSNYLPERSWLVSVMPESLKAATKKFTSIPSTDGEYRQIPSDYIRFLDLYVDAAITHADYLKTLSEIEL